MSAEEKVSLESLAKSAEVLPEIARQYLIGFGEGVAAMAAAMASGGVMADKAETRGEV